MKITIEQIQIIEKEMLKETLDILKRNGVTFYMCCGSVLGAVRHKGPIPWDTDMDILIPLSHPNFLKNIAGRLIEIFCSPFSKKQLTERFYRLISQYGYDDAEYVMNACGHYGAKNIFKKQVFGTPVTVPYCDIEVPLPEQYDFYLKRYYNDYMSLPPKEERDSWLGFTLDIDGRDYASVEGVLNNEQK